MGAVVFDVMDLSAKRRTLKRREPGAEALHLPMVGQARADGVEPGPLPEGEHGLLQKVGLGIARDRDMRNLRERGSRVGQYGADRTLWKAGPVFDSVEALLLKATAKETVRQQSGRGVAVERVDAEDVVQREPPSAAIEAGTSPIEPEDCATSPTSPRARR